MLDIFKIIDRNHFSLAKPIAYERKWITSSKGAQSVLVDDSLFTSSKNDAWSSELESFHEKPVENGWIEKYERNLVKDIFTKLNLNSEKVILEFGSSFGYMIHLLKKVFPKNSYVSTDLFIEGLKESHKKGPEIMHIQCDITDAPFKDSSFDFIYSLSVLEHIEDDRKAMAECRRLLKDDGYCLFVVPRGQHLYDFFDGILHHKRRYSQGELKQKCLEAGFEVVYNTHFAWLCYPAFFLKKKMNILKGRKMSQEEKLRVFEKETANVMASSLGDFVMKIEKQLSRLFNPAFGVRELIVVKKTNK